MIDYKYLYVESANIDAIQKFMDTYSCEGYMLTYIYTENNHTLILFEKELILNA